jgi:hypothetical protein
MSHVVNPLDIEDFNLKIGGEGHGISCTNVTMLLTSWAPSHKILGILVHSGPKETTLPNFCIGTECPIVSSIF